MWEPKGVMIMRNKRIILINIIIFIVFNVIAFVVPTDFIKTFWVAYGFTVLSFAIQLFMWIVFFEKNPDATSRFYRMPILSVCNRYMSFQIIAFLVFKFFSTIPIWVAVVVNIIILVVALIGFITLSDAADYIAYVDAKVKTKVSFIKNLQAEVELLIDDVEDADTKKILEELAEKIRFSDPMSDSSLVHIEESIRDNIVSMKMSDSDTKVRLTRDTLKLIEERNKKCKLLK